jgi:hypothetical protein
VPSGSWWESSVRFIDEEITVVPFVHSCYN